MLWLGRAERDVEDEVFLRSPNRKITGRRRSGLVETDGELSPQARVVRGRLVKHSQRA
jgi:hypothetical protein